jgi:outer membrane protein OmpA-like peptidoglycan-associated protein
MESEIMNFRRSNRPLRRCTPVAVILAGLFGLGAAPALANDADAINERLYQALDGSPNEKKIERVSDQLYLSKKNMDAAVISDALAALLDGQVTQGENISVRREPSLNFEIHFNKNTAEMTPDSRDSLDQLGEVLESHYQGIRFVIGGHTDLDGDPAVNVPLSQARADATREYLVKNHSIAEERLAAQGFGSAEPLMAVEKSVKDKQYNRRVDLRPLR